LFLHFYVNKKEDGILEPLQEKHVLTGINLECLACILENKESHYDSDVYDAVLSFINYVSFSGPVQITFCCK